MPAADDGAAVQALLTAGHWKRARAILEPRVASNPSAGEPYYQLSRVKTAYHEYEAALPLAEKAVALDARDIRFHTQLGIVLGRLAQKASLLKQIGLAKRSRKEFEAALALNPDYLNALEALMNYTWEAPGVVGGDKNKARDIAGHMTRIDPVRGLLAQAQLALWQDDSAKAEELYRKAAESTSTSFEALIDAAGAELNEKPPKYNLAERYALAAEAMAPDRAGSYIALARVYAGQGRMADLNALLAKAAQDDPDNLHPRLAAAEVLLANGHELPRAEALAREYLAQEPEGEMPTIAQARWRLALILEKEGRTKEALAELSAAHRQEPGNDAIDRDVKRLKHAD